MAMSKNRNDREFSKFVDSPSRPGSAAVETVSFVGNLLSGINFDSISFSYPDSRTEVFTYYLGGLDGDVVAIVTAIYYDTSKRKLKSIGRQ
jgi:hypothetical protein